MKNTAFHYIFVLFVFSNCTHKPEVEIRDDFKKFYDRYNVTGSFILFDAKAEKYYYYNQEQLSQSYTPASTFKICNSLIGLETGVIKDENFVIKWDSVIRNHPNWNKDNDLKTAFQNSTVWYYQEMARKIGGKRMKYWLDKANYGNADTSRGIDKFWLSSGLTITPHQQIDFLISLNNYQLPFSKRSIDIVKKIMVAKDTLNFVVRAKTGWGNNDNQEIGWYVGYVETHGNVYYFANCIQCSDINSVNFANARIAITYLILDALNITKNRDIH